MTIWTKEKSLAMSEPYELHKFWIGEEVVSVAESNQVIRYVDPDAPGPTHDGTSWNNAYLSLDAWDKGEATNLVSDGNYHTVYCRSSGGTADTVQTTVGSDWTMDSTHYVDIRGFDFPTDGRWDESAYRMEVTGYQCIGVDGLNHCVKIRNMQLHCKETFDGELRAVDVSHTCGNNSVVEVGGCYMKSSGTLGGNTNIGVANKGSGLTIIYNSILYDWKPYRSPAVGGSWAIRNYSDTGTINVYNCTICQTG